MIVTKLMTKAPTVVQPNTTLRDAARLMLAQHVSGLPVQNEAGDLVGIITEADLLRRAELGTEHQAKNWFQTFFASGKSADDYVRTHGRRVDEVMTRSVVTVTPNTPLADAAEVMHKKRLKCLPVMDAGKLVGVINRSDFLKALVSELVAAESNKPTEESIRARIMEALTAENVTQNSDITVEVAGQAVILNGTVVDGDQREAVVVIAKNTQGVSVVHDRLKLEDRGDAVGF
jgi:CBS-domain-containing membrane protein